MADDKAAKLKALQLTLDKLDKTYGKGSVMKLGDEAVEGVFHLSLQSLGPTFARAERSKLPKGDVDGAEEV